MELNLIVEPNQPKPPDLLRRQTNDTSVLFESSDGSQENEVVTLVMSRRLKRRMRNAAQNSSPRTSTIFTTVRPTDNPTTIGKRGLSMFLENLAPGQLKEARFNPLKNVIVIDAMNVLGMEATLKGITIGDAPVRPYVPRGSNTTLGVISGVVIYISVENLMTKTSAAKKVVQMRRFEPFLLVKIVVAGNSLPSHVKSDLIRYHVRLYLPQATPC